MTTEEPTGVVIPEADGRRSTTALGRAVVADALQAADPIGSRAAERETNWRSGYLTHFRRLVEASLPSRDAALGIAHAGLDSLHERMRVRRDDGTQTRFDALFSTPPQRPFTTVTVTGDGDVERELSLPYRGERLRGDALHRQLDRWVARGVMEPTCAEAVRTVANNADWLDLSDQRVVVLGAGAEMGPLHALLHWGGEVMAVDLPHPQIWERVLAVAHQNGGRLHVPVRSDRGHDDKNLADRAGADLLEEVPAVAEWLLSAEAALALGNYVYADGAMNVRVAMAVDALTLHVQQRRDDVALAFLATPTDVFVVPGDAVEHAHQAYEQRSRTAKLVSRPLRTFSGGRLLQRNYVGGADPGIHDALVSQQGPNYALAKRLQRWRAMVARDAGANVSLNVAPPTRTRSVVKNRGLAAAYAGAHRFGIEIFEPATSNTLMAALLVHDLRTQTPARGHPWQDEASSAVHGGLWRGPYDPRSVLGLAAVLGLGAART